MKAESLINTVTKEYNDCQALSPASKITIAVSPVDRRHLHLSARRLAALQLRERKAKTRYLDQNYVLIRSLFASLLMSFSTIANFFPVALNVIYTQ